MSVKQIIPFGQVKEDLLDPQEKGPENILRVSEFYYDTIQGEGVYAGQPAAFLRLQGCPLNCLYCDTAEVWKKGNSYTIEELLILIDGSNLIQQLRKGQHLVITGGSPLLQQGALENFILSLEQECRFKPFIEIENECYFIPTSYLSQSAICWNNSPKLSSSGVPFEKRYDSSVIQYMASLPESWFKFVITKEEDWEEIENGFLSPRLIRRNQIILMPEGAAKQEIEAKREMVVEMAIENNVRYCTREHIVIWGKKTGI